MGRDKALLRLGGRTMIEHIRATAKRTGWRVRVIRRDLWPRCGPLGGIYTGLVTAQSDAVLFLACDMPFVEAGLLHRLFEVSRSRSAVFTRTGTGVGFPFLIPQQNLSLITKQLRAGPHSIQHLAKVVKGKTLRVPPELKHQTLNVNRPAEWQSAKKLWKNKVCVRQRDKN